MPGIQYEAIGQYISEQELKKTAKEYLNKSPLPMGNPPHKE